MLAVFILDSILIEFSFIDVLIDDYDGFSDQLGVVILASVEIKQLHLHVSPSLAVHDGLDSIVVQFDEGRRSIVKEVLDLIV